MSYFVYSFSEANLDTLNTPCIVYIFLAEDEFKTYIAVCDRIV